MTNFTRQLSSQYYRCDPHQHIANETFYQLINFDQAYIINEANMDTNTCKGNCEDHASGSIRTCNNYNSENSFPCKWETECKKFYNCEYMGGTMEVCDSKSPLRRYEHIDFENEAKKCPSNKHHELTWFPRLFLDCTYCICYCDEMNDKSDRIISTQSQVSNITANEVITGMRVVKLEHVFYLQIQVGKLLPEFAIDQSSVRWQKIHPIEHIQYDKQGYDEEANYIVLKRKDRMDLDTFMMNNSEVLTGKILN